jgi:phage/plasmid-associated DNA primase
MENNPRHKAWALLLDRLCVVDADTEEAVCWLERDVKDPDVRSAMDQCPIQLTKKGKHFVFLRPAWADEEGYWDGARQKGKGLDVDLKTVCSTGTRGVLVVAPSDGKRWVDGRAPWDEGVALVEMPRALAELVAVAKTPSSAPVISPVQLSHPASKAGPVSAKPLLPSARATPVNIASNLDIEDICALVGILSTQRADSYPTWMAVGWCLHNLSGHGGGTSVSLLPEWIRFSRQSTKFCEGECERLWASMRPEGKGAGSLCLWAKEDSPMEYRQIMNRRVFSDIKDCNGSHNDVARIAAKLLAGLNICATANGKLWYTFDGTLWREDPEAIKVRHELSTTVRGQFMATLGKVSAQQSKEADDIHSHSGSSSQTASREGCARVAAKLQDAGFKDAVLKEMREYLFDPCFLRSLDSNPNLIAFENGVWELHEKRFRAALPEDRLSLSVGYTYSSILDPELHAKARGYLAALHPNDGQRDYVVRTFARQLFGDSGQELFHVHAGCREAAWRPWAAHHLASASNGKTKFFETLELCCGGYVRKFGVEMLTAKQRIDPGKPMPEFEKWRGVRILYCSEPNHEDQLNSGIMKDLTGGEVITYRLLHSNDVQQFRPQFKMHVMTNDAPSIDGSDSGVKRRVRKIDYVSRFVDSNEADAARHMYPRDPTIIQAFKDNIPFRMEFLRLLLDAYDHAWEFPMTDAVRESSRDYIEENDAVLKFAKQWIEKAPDEFFTLKDAKTQFAECEYFNQRIRALKTDLQKVLGTVCHTQKWINGANLAGVFMGYRLRSPDEVVDQAMLFRDSI